MGSPRPTVGARAGGSGGGGWRRVTPPTRSARATHPPVRSPPPPHTHTHAHTHLQSASPWGSSRPRTWRLGGFTLPPPAQKSPHPTSTLKTSSSSPTTPPRVGGWEWAWVGGGGWVGAAHVGCCRRRGRCCCRGVEMHSHACMHARRADDEESEAGTSGTNLQGLSDGGGGASPGRPDAARAASLGCAHLRLSVKCAR